MTPSIMHDYNGLLTLLRMNNPSGFNFCIAGGAIRDLIFSKEIADIDVFYWGPVGQIFDTYRVVVPYGEGSNYQVTHEFPWSKREITYKVQLIKIAP